jgi:hypothetical protein
MRPYVEAAQKAYNEAAKENAKINPESGSSATATTDAAKAQAAVIAADSALSAANYITIAAQKAAYTDAGGTSQTYDKDANNASSTGVSATAAATAKTSAEAAKEVAEYADARVALDAVSVDADGNYQGDTLYYYNYNFYTSLAALGDVMVLPTLNGNGSDGKEAYDEKGRSNIQILSDYGATRYVRNNAAYRTQLASSSSTSGDNQVTEAPFVTYYHYILKHYEHGTTDEAQLMAPMKYAVVRNNVYQMSVKGVYGLGSGSVDPTDPDPDDKYYPGPNPDDQQQVYLKMELQVRHWVVRNQGGTITLK